MQQPDASAVVNLLSFTLLTVGKICDKPLSLSDDNKFPPIKVFLGSGGIKYGDVRSTRAGWCASGSTPYLLIDLQKEYHLTHVMVIADKEQTKWSNSYSMKYSRTKTLINSSRSLQVSVIVIDYCKIRLL
jgi:hypothetical protein